MGSRFGKRSTTSGTNASTEPCAQPRHWDIGYQEVQRDEPGGSGNYEGCRDASRQKEAANEAGERRAASRGGKKGRQGSNERADGVREKGEEEMLWRQQMDSCGETLGIAHVNADWRRNHMRACYDERHINDATYHKANEDC
ncbi:MAG: hypothetical protein RIS76_2228 [Verrucomicrobiota bacterium]|jgi:hypothetical protein